MNIWILNHYAITPDMSGITRHYDLARVLVKRGYTITIFASSFNYVTRTEERLQKREFVRTEEHEGIRFVWIKTFPYHKNDWKRVINWLSYAVGVFLIGIKIKEKPDVIIGSSAHLFTPLSAYALSQLKKSRFIFEVRDLWPKSLIDIGSISENHPLIVFFRLVEGFLYTKAEKIITPLPNAYEHIKKFGIAKEKVVWIPNGVDMTLFDNIPHKEKNETFAQYPLTFILSPGGRGRGEGVVDKKTIMQKFKNDKEIFTVMYVGAHGQANALDVVLDAARIIQDKGIETIRFVFIGDGVEKKNLMEKGERLKLKNVEFRQAVPKENVPAAMAEADIFIFNLEDSQVFDYGVSPNKLFEYMAAGKPVIFSCEAANNPVNASGSGVTVSPRDPEALVKSVIDLYSLSPEKRAEIGKKGKLYVQKNHDICKIGERLVNILWK